VINIIPNFLKNESSYHHCNFCRLVCDGVCRQACISLDIFTPIALYRIVRISTAGHYRGFVPPFSKNYKPPEIMMTIDINGLVVDVMKHPEYTSAALVVFCAIAIIIGFVAQQKKKKI